MKSSTLYFLQQLEKNNNRPWFNEHKNWYTEAHEDVISFVEELISEISKFDQDIEKVDAKKSLFRIYRDTRFSLNKQPYKTNFGATLRFGKTSKKAGYYLHIEPRKSFIGGGLYMPDSENLKRIRKEITTEKETFIGILENSNFRNYFRGLSVEGKLKRVPNGFDKEDPMAEYLKLKHFIVSHPVSDEALLDSNAAKNFAEIYRSIQPLNHFLNNALIVD